MDTLCGTVDGGEGDGVWAHLVRVRDGRGPAGPGPRYLGPGVAPGPDGDRPWGATTLTVISTAAGETCTLACSAGTARNLGEYRGSDGVYIMFEKKSAPMCLLR